LVFVPLVIGWLIALAGGLWFLGVAFNDSAGRGLLCLIIPLYSLVYLISHWEDTKRPFFTQLVGTGMAMISLFMAVLVKAFEP
jgi:hypothetical protein